MSDNGISDKPSSDKPSSDVADDTCEQSDKTEAEAKAVEYGGPKGKEPTRYGDWEKNGRCIDF